MPWFRRQPGSPDVPPSARTDPLRVDADRSRSACRSLMTSGEPIPCDLATPAGAIRCSACLRLSGDGQRRHPSIVHPEVSSLDEPCSTPDRSATRLLGNGGTWRGSVPSAFVCEAHFAFAERHGFSHEAGLGEDYWVARYVASEGWCWRDGSPVEVAG
jgi:hypothetical protein